MTEYEDRKKKVQSEKEILERLKEKENDLEGTEDALNNISNDDLESLREQEKETNINLNLAKKREREYKDKKLGAIKQYAWAIFGADFARQSLDFIDESVISGELPEPYNQQFIEKILSEKECICGACLEPEVNRGKKSQIC